MTLWSGAATQLHGRQSGAVGLEPGGLRGLQARAAHAQPSVTRPGSASVARYLGKARHEGGLQLPRGCVFLAQALHIRHLLYAQRRQARFGLCSTGCQNSQPAHCQACAAALARNPALRAARRLPCTDGTPCPALPKSITPNQQSARRRTCSGTADASTAAITALRSELEANVATWRPPWPSNTPKAEKATWPARKRRERRGSRMRATEREAGGPAQGCDPGQQAGRRRIGRGGAASFWPSACARHALPPPPHTAYLNLLRLPNLPCAPSRPHALAGLISH